MKYIIVILFSIISCSEPLDNWTRFERIKHIHHLHLTQYFFEEIIPVERKDKLRILLLVPCQIESYADLDQMEYAEEDSTIFISLPDIQLTEVLARVDSARIYDFKKFGITLTSHPYSEVVNDLKNGLVKAKHNVKHKAIEQGILEDSENELKDFILSFASTFTDKRVVFNREE